MASIVGIDLGSQKAVIAVVQGGGVEIICNEVSNRKTPCIIGFGEKERFLGEMAFNKLKSNFRNTVLFPTRFVGLRTQNNKVGFEVKYQGQNCVFTCEKLIAMLLKKFKLTLRASEINGQDMCISVPGYLTQSERQDILDACAIAEINCLKLMNEGTAIALDYGIFRKNELTEEPRIVVFFDMGHSKTSCTVAQFTKNQLKILASAHDRHLGGRDFDYVIMEKFCNEFERQNGVNPLKNPKAKIRLQDQVEKLKKVLSANNEANLNVDCLHEDQDLNAVVSRKEFEELSSSLISRVYQVLEQASQGIDLALVYSIEIVGGASRIPMVQQALRDFFKKEVSRTLNAEESIARGCAVQAAIISPQFQVSSFGIEDISGPSISLKYSASKSSEIFAQNTIFPTQRHLVFDMNETTTLQIFYTNQTTQGIPQFIGN